MLESFGLFVQHILNFGKFNVSQFPKKAYRELMTATEEMLRQDFVMIPSLVNLAKDCPGHLVIDDTSNPKYGLKEWSKKLYIPSTGGFLYGFKIVMFLWVCDTGHYPIGFGLWHKGSSSLIDIALKGLSLLRNHNGLRRCMVLADGAYSTNAVLKRLDDYGYGFVMRFKGNRKLDNRPIPQLIPRGYGQVSGFLQNGVKVNVIREGEHFLVTNRMLLERQAIQELYALRWKIEEAFRCLKSVIGINGCQQVSMRAQAVYLTLCFLLFSCLESHWGGHPYKVAQAVISGALSIPELISNKTFLIF
jgi:Transposase DDE domain